MTRARLLLCLILVVGGALRVGYASYGLHNGRFWDERYALLNVTSLIEGRTLKPLKSYYPSPVFNLPAAAAVVAADRLVEASGGDPRRVYENGSYGPGGYLVCRLLQVLAGVLAIAVVFRLGRRMFGAGAGLIAAAALAFAPWPLHASAVFKPDSLVLLTVAVATDLALSAVRRPTAWRYALAGVGIALAASGKLTGVTVALTVAVGSLWPGKDLRRRIVGLAIAGGTSLVAFFALNPYGWWYLHWVNSLKEDYAMRAGWEEASRASVLRQTAGLLLDSSMFGPLFGGVALAGLAWLTLRSLRGKAEDARDCAMLFLFPWIHAVFYASQTTYFKPNNLFPALPAAAVALGWVLQGLSRKLIPDGGWARRRLRTAALGTAVVALAAPGWSYVYRSLTPTTLDAALYRLSPTLRRAPAGRLVFVESSLRPEGIAWEGLANFDEEIVSVIGVEAISDLHQAEIAGADAVVFAAERLEGGGGYLYRAYLPATTRGEELRLKRRAFSLRGPEVAVRFKRWRPKRPRRSLELRPCAPPSGRGCRRATSAVPIAEGALVSIVASVPWEIIDSWNGAPSVRAGGLRLPLRRAVRRTREGFLYTTARFRWPAVEAGGVEIDFDVELSPKAARSIVVEAHRWRNAAKSSS